MGVASLLPCGSSGSMWGVRLGDKHFYQSHKANLKLLKTQKVSVNADVTSTTWMLEVNLGIHLEQFLPCSGVCTHRVCLVFEKCCVCVRG